MENLTWTGLPKAQLRAWARDPVTTAFLGLLNESRVMRIDSLVASCAPSASHEMAVWQNGGLEVLTLLITEINQAGVDNE
jgi:hypothetical protein